MYSDHMPCQLKAFLYKCLSHCLYKCISPCRSDDKTHLAVYGNFSASVPTDGFYSDWEWNSGKPVNRHLEGTPSTLLVANGHCAFMSGGPATFPGGTNTCSGPPNYMCDYFMYNRDCSLATSYICETETAGM